MIKPNQPTSSGQATLLAIGDIHLGTRCSGLPVDLSSWGIEPEQLTPAAALDAAVDLAIQMRVDAVLRSMTASPVDLAVLDIKMPRMDGVELLKRLRQTSSLPVTVVGYRRKWDCYR